MIDRRSFVRHGVALAASGAAWRWPEAAAATAPAPDATVIGIVDRDSSGSAAFAAAVRARGVRLLEFRSDVAALWMRELEPRLRSGSVVIEGHTSAATQFCLEFLARDYGARLVHRVDAAAVMTWSLSSSPVRRAALAPIQSRGSQSDA